MTSFTDKKKYIKSDVINLEFPRLNDDEKNVLADILAELIEILYLKFLFSDPEEFWIQLQKNKNRDLLTLLYTIIPNIHDDENVNIADKLTSFNDLYVAKNKEGRYIYSSVQYARCEREIIEGTNNTGVKFKKETLFNLDHLKQNKDLLKDTIQIISNKLYVNWQNIVPLNLFEYQQSILYQNTIQAIAKQEIDWWDAKSEKGKYYRGLYIGDIYNTFVHSFYSDIKHIKWLIYEINVDNTYQYLLKVLHQRLGLDSALQEIPWLFLSETEKNRFSIQWNNLVDQATIAYSIDNQLLSSLYVGIKLFHERFKDEEKGIGPNIEDYTEEEPDDGEVLNIDTVKVIPISHIYAYLLYGMQQLKRTWYGEIIYSYDQNGKYYFSQEDVKIEEKKEMHFQQIKNNVAKQGYLYQKDNNFVTLKNLYDVGKALCKFGDGKLPIMYWNELDGAKRNTVIERLLDPNIVLTWFRRRSHDLIKRNSPFIFTFIQNNLVDFVFQSLCKKGVLSQVILKNAPNYLSGWITNNHYDQCYYELTQKPYRDTTWFSEKKKKNISFTDHLSSNQWYKRYSLDWMMQIQIYHHFLHNRVILVTGQTGVGKSTTIPRLFLHAMIAFEYRNDANIAISQPRISPTYKNAIRVAEEMGLPIEEYSPTLKKRVATPYYYIQYEYHEKNHASSQRPFIKFITDGLLLREIIRSDILKVTKKLPNHEIAYLQRNIYDMVIVDEAHEHNINMDLILTHLKYTTFYNNSLRLVIISATMIEDEHIYTRYYSPLNDNLLYPLNWLLVNNKLDRINVGRHIDIANHSIKTIFKIDSVYLTEAEFRPLKDEIESIIKMKEDNDDEEIKQQPLRKVVNKAIQTALNITSKTREGDVIIFVPGKKEISQIVKNLNETTPSYCIALPYHREMQVYRNILESEDIVTPLSQLQINKLDVMKRDRLNDLSLNKTNEKTVYHDNVPIGTYKRLIIVATNIAESSITIPTLRFAIDTGLQRISIYDTERSKSTLMLDKISQTSQIQRRGRIGRVANGVIYYLYTQNWLSESSHKYHITLERLNSYIFSLLMYPMEFSGKHESTKHFDAAKRIEQQYIEIVKYFNELKSPLEIYPTDYSTTGYEWDKLMDPDGTFYLIHPDENLFQRDPAGNITKIKRREITSDQVFYESAKITTVFESLSTLFLIAKEEKEKKNKIRGKEFESNSNYMKTLYGIIIEGLTNYIKFNLPNNDEIPLSLVISYLFSHIYQSQDEMIYLIIALIEIYQRQLGVFQLCADTDHLKGIENFKNTWVNPKSDHLTILNVVKSLLPLIKKFRQNYDTKKFYQKYREDIQKWISFRSQVLNGKMKRMEIPNYIENYEILQYFFDTRKRLIEMKDVCDDIKLMEKFTKDYLFKKGEEYLKVKESELKEICYNQHLNYGFVENFFKKCCLFDQKLIELLQVDLTKITPLIPLDYEFVNMKEYLSRIHTYPHLPKEEKIMKPFIHGFGNFVGVKYQNKNYRIFHQFNQFDIATLITREKDYQTYPLTGIEHINNYFLSYPNLQTGDSVVSNLNPKWIVDILPHQANRRYLTGMKFILRQKGFDPIISKVISDITIYSPDFTLLSSIPDPMVKQLLRYISSNIQFGGSNKNHKKILKMKQIDNQIYSIKCYRQRDKKKVLQMLINLHNHTFFIQHNHLKESSFHIIFSQIMKKISLQYK